ncbi:MAG: diacylglycerol kinase family protein [Vicinamibacterales bacterium]
MQPIWPVELRRIAWKIAVFYNNDAGSSVSADDIRRLIEDNGHQLVHLVEKSEGLPRIFDQAADVVVAAGGDGTVASVARAVAGRSIPLAVLPLGTANNIAISLGCNGPLDALVAHWARVAPVKTDLGVATGPWGDRRFVEGVGGGLVARAISTMDATPIADDTPTHERIRMALGAYLDELSTLKARPWTLRLDGTLVEDDFLLVEVLNIQSIGPNFAIAHCAELSDGQFTVVLARETEREQLCAYWRARIEGQAPALSLDTRHATQVIIDHGDDMHIDDTLFPAAEDGAIRLWVDKAALSVIRGPFPR